MADIDFILCECNLEPLETLVSSFEHIYTIEMVRPPAICMTMIEAEDSVEFQPFYLGEALTTECEIQIEGQKGYGICLGDEPVRGYCMAVIDALVAKEGAELPALKSFLETQGALIEEKRKIEHNHILRSKVDFKLMGQD